MKNRLSKRNRYVPLFLIIAGLCVCLYQDGIILPSIISSKMPVVIMVPCVIISVFTSGWFLIYAWMCVRIYFEKTFLNRRK
jgi:hypothetical protein